MPTTEMHALVPLPSIHYWYDSDPVGDCEISECKNGCTTAQITFYVYILGQIQYRFPTNYKGLFKFNSMVLGRETILRTPTVSDAIAIILKLKLKPPKWPLALWNENDHGF